MPFDWTPEAIEWLKQAWADGHTTSKIAKMAGVSKNAIVGKIHRLKLESRPSPIKRGFGALPREKKLAAPSQIVAEAVIELPPKREPALPVVAAEIFSETEPSLPPPTHAAEILPGWEKLFGEQFDVEPVHEVKAQAKPTRQCEHLSGDRRNYVRCEAEQIGRGPYCEEHAALCFTRTKKHVTIPVTTTWQW